MRIRSLMVGLALLCSLWIVAGSAVAAEDDAPEQAKVFFPVRGAERGTALRGHLVGKARS